MAQGRSAAYWSHTSAILAMIANVNRDPKTTPRAWMATDFNPHVSRPKTKPLFSDIKMRDIKDLLVGGLGLKVRLIPPSTPVVPESSNGDG